MKLIDLGSPRKAGRRKSFIALIAVLLMVVFSVGGLLAYIVTNTDTIVNKFTPGVISCDVTEDFDGGAIKKNVAVKNTGNSDAYIRAYINITWMADGTSTNQTVTAKMPKENSDYTISFAENSGWNRGDDGYWYYSGSVAAGGSTAVLVTECKLLDGASVPNGYRLSVEIIASAIQAKPTDAVTQKWNVKLDGDKIFPKNNGEAAK